MMAASSIGSPYNYFILRDSRAAHAAINATIPIRNETLRTDWAVMLIPFSGLLHGHFQRTTRDAVQSL